jgi:hypothetical protein
LYIEFDCGGFHFGSHFVHVLGDQPFLEPAQIYSPPLTTWYSEISIFRVADDR